MSDQADKCMHARDWAASLPDDTPIVVVIGAMAHGKETWTYTDEAVSISEYPLSASLVCAKVCGAFEDRWGIV